MKKLLILLSLFSISINILCSEKEKKEREGRGFDPAERAQAPEQQQQAVIEDDEFEDDEFEDDEFEDYKDFYLLATAVKENNEANVKKLLAQGVDPYKNLIAASKNGNIKIIQMLLDAGADPKIKDDYGNTAEKIAMENNHQDIAKLLKEFKVSPIKIKKWELERNFLRRRKGEILMEGLKIGVDAYGGSILDYIPNNALKIFSAIYVNNHGLLKKALHEKQNINAQTKRNKTTPLMYAAKLNRPMIVKLLLKANADTSLQDKDGKRFIDYARQNPQVMEIVKQYKDYVAAFQRTLGKKVSKDIVQHNITPNLFNVKYLE